jgi:pimeloyl-ACP methyl ester carboxylesterase
MEKVTLILLVALAGLCTLIGALILLETQRVKRDLSSGTPPGRRVALAGRNLHLRCKGMGHPLVIIEQGAGEPSRFWWPLQDQIATFTRVCTYDRAGYGWSDPAPGDRTVADRAAELRALLAAADLSGPCILVAHSYGGLIVRAFARSYPELTAGLVLVDTAEEETLRQPEVLTMYRRFRVMLRLFEGLARLGLVRFLGTLVDLERFGMPGTRAMEFAAAADDLASIERGSAAERTSSPPGCLGALPVAVITHGVAFPGPFAVLENGWKEGQERLLGLSSNARAWHAEDSNHMIHLDQTEIVLEAIRWVWEQSHAAHAAPAHARA